MRINSDFVCCVQWGNAGRDFHKHAQACCDVEVWDRSSACGVAPPHILLKETSIKKITNEV